MPRAFGRCRIATPRSISTGKTAAGKLKESLCCDATRDARRITGKEGSASPFDADVMIGIPYAASSGVLQDVKRRRCVILEPFDFYGLVI